MTWTIEGKTVLITGGARGLGAVTAESLAKSGAKRIYLIDWEGEEGTRTRDRINTACGRGVTEFIYADLSDLDQVKALTERVKRDCDALHVLINNAGITDSIYRLSPQGNEMHIATNHLSHFLLTRELLPLMKASAPARIITISSDAHKAGPGLDFEDMNNVGLWKGKAVSGGGAFQAYHRSKLANLYHMLGLHEQLAGTGVTANAVSPGYFVNTTIYRNTHGVLGICARALFGFLGMCGINTPAKGARSHIWLAASDEASGLSGRYIEHCKEKAMADLALDADIRRQLWEWSEAETSDR